MSTFALPAVLHTASGAHVLALRLADRFIARFCGLMFATPLSSEQGLLITKCPSVHTAFMRQTIDVVYLDGAGYVTKCVARLRPWHGSVGTGKDGSGRRIARARHVLELAAGAIERLRIAPGDRLEQAFFQNAAEASAQPAAGHERFASTAGTPRGTARQRGAAMIEFTIVGPIITLLGLTILQYGMLFFAKNQINHASFMSARAGSMGNADLDKVQQAYTRALVPLYGGGRDSAELATSYAKALTDTAGRVRYELLNPTAESFADYNDARLQATIGGGRRVIPNSGQAFKADGIVKTASGQTIQDANLIKLRITHGYEPKVPLVGRLYTQALRLADDASDPFHTSLIQAGRIPIVTHATMQMQSDAIEGDAVSVPGPGNAEPGNPRAPYEPPPPPDCRDGGCSREPPPSEPPPPDTPANPGGECTGATCPVCPVPGLFSQPITLEADLYFDFNESTLTEAGRKSLDALVEQTNLAIAHGQELASVRIVGHTDQIGSDAANGRLSLARAEAVKRYLQQNGFPPDVAIATEGRGERDPKVALSNCPPSGPAQIQCLAPNRRVVVIPVAKK